MFLALVIPVAIDSFNESINVENNFIFSLFIFMVSPAQKPPDFDPHFPGAWDLQQKMQDWNKRTNMYTAKTNKSFQEWES